MLLTHFGSWQKATLRTVVSCIWDICGVMERWMLD